MKKQEKYNYNGGRGFYTEGIDLSDVSRTTPYDEIVAALAPRLGVKTRLLPMKWEKVGEVLILRYPETLRAQSDWICEAYARVLGCKTVFSDVGGIEGQHRVPQVEWLWGSQDAVTAHHENGVRFRLDPATLMFSSGNMAERVRMGQIVKKGETIVDLFAGIGYFTLPMAVHGNPTRIYACEINPISYGFLCQNIVLNHVTETVVPLLGDNRVVAPHGVADRVVMGYLEDTDAYFLVALECLRKNGGIVHYHEAVPTLLCPQRPLHQLERIAVDHDHNVRLLSWREVKSYAPGVSHVVLDVQVSPHG